MAGETRRLNVVKEAGAESKLQDGGTVLEQQSDRSKKESSEHFSSTGTDTRASSKTAKGEKIEKERDCPQQREAVIRPQQAGKIDFRSLQNRSKFPTDRTWSSGKGGPQSPKGRSREKAKRSGKAERGNPQQLYRLSITNPRTIGIAYPQQKVLPPKTLDPSHRPVLGSYRFNVPSIPEREVEQQQEELIYSHHFQEGSSNLTSPNYTSQALSSPSGAASHLHPPLSQQLQPPSMENNGAQPGSQLTLTDFQLGGSNAWQSPERTSNGANYEVLLKKTTALSEASKTGAFIPSQFQYGYYLMEESTSDSFSFEQNQQSQDFSNSSHGSVHVTNNTSFTPGEGQNIARNDSQFGNHHQQQPDERPSCPQPPLSQFIKVVPSSINCPRNLSEDSTSSDSSGSSSLQSEQGKTLVSTTQDVIGPADSRDDANTSESKKSCHPKDTTANQRPLVQGSVHARSVSHGSGSPIHFANKPFTNPPINNIHTASMPFNKNINNNNLNRIQHVWEGHNKTYPAEQNTFQYTDMNDKFMFQNQPALEQGPNSSKNSRMPWQHSQPTSAMLNQNRVEFSRPISKQKLAYIIPPSDWQDDNKSHKINNHKTPGSYQNARTPNQRQESLKHGSNTVSTFKVEMSHAQVCEAKNKTVFFGLNQSVSTAPPRNYNYPPLQVPSMGLMMVSPYESPLPSPVHNPASSSTCSSLSPASNSPVNTSSEESQMTKTAHLFYHQPQGKTQLPADHLSTHTHQFHSDTARSLVYTQDRSKDDMMGYLHNNPPQKAAMGGMKGYMDSFGMEHHQPPPPYSAHQLLASSLATANLDQLDVLLTCKQCDQNFNNLASFLGHKQYCSQHTVAQKDLKDHSKIEDHRKFHAEATKAVLAVSNPSMSRCPSDLHLSLLGLNKNGELVSENETKGEAKEDQMKLGLFSGTNNLPVPLPELEMEDPKLDSLITEALNGLGYQSDNAEIDSSFIDAFVDDELSTVKSSSNKQCLKKKESIVFESKHKQTIDDRSFTSGKYFYDSDAENPEKISLNSEQEKIKVKKEVTHTKSTIASREKIWQQGSKVKEARKLCKSEDGNTSTQRFILSSKFSERCGLKSFQENSVLRGSTPSQSSTSPTSRSAVKESKRKSTGGGTWSKELIHKIVQQKNKLNKLHVKGTKNLQFSLVMERLTPSAQNPAFGEYDYVSDTDDECEPVKIASQGRLNQSSRCKYTYTKECKWRARSERDQAAWRRESKECFEMKKREEVCLSPEKPDSYLRIRKNRSSTSSEHSTSVSVSSDGLNSPKSTDSDCEKKTDTTKECPEQEHNDKSSSQTLFKQSSTLALTFTKSVKKCNSDKAIVSENKSSVKDVTKYHSNTEFISLLSSSQKTKDCITMEKGRNSQTKSRDKLLQKENNSGNSPNKNRTDNLYQSEELSGNTRSLEFDSDSSSKTKESDFNIDRIPKSNDREEPEATQLELSDSSVFEQSTDRVHVLKENLSLVSDVDTHKPASLCNSLMDDVCLSPNESQSPLMQKDPLHLMPYPLDQEQTLIKSPLTFDTSSMFGELTGFDSGLYSEIPIQKATFNSMDNATDKKEEFVSSFSPFLEQRDWNLMVSTELPDEISQYKDNSEKANEKKQDYHRIPLSLPEKIIDYSANLTSCASEDELEIKRIVNELETQLQTTKLETPPLLTQDIHKNLQMSKFSPLRLGDESDNEGSSLNMKCPVQTMEVENTNMPSECFPQPGLAWSSDFQFALMGEHHSAHTPIHNETEALEDITKKDAHAAKLIPTALHDEQQEAQISKNKTAEQETAMETKEAMLEEKRYTENLIKSLEVISDSIFKKEHILSEHNSPCENSLPNQQPQETECQASESNNPSEKDRKENSLSPLSISEEKDKTEVILPYQADLTVRGCRPISPQPCETTENTAYMTESQVLLGGKITTLLEFTDSSNVATSKLHEEEDSCKKDTNKDKVNPLFIINHGGQENSTADICVEEEDIKGVRGQSTDELSHSAPDVSHLDVMKAALQTVDKDDNSDAGLLNNSCVDLLKEELSVKQSKRSNLLGLGFSNSFSPLETFSETEMPVQIINSARPCSPLLVKPDTECISHNSPFQSPQPVDRGRNVLTLSHAESFIASDSNMNESLASENFVLDSIQNQEEVLKVPYLPVDFMASEHNSSGGEEQNQSVISEMASSTLLSYSSPKKSEQKCDKKEEICGLQKKSFNKSSVQNEKDVQNNTKDQNVKEASEGVEMTPTNEEPYSLISPPHLDLGALESSENIQPVISTTEPVNALDGLLKKNLRCEFKISTLNCTSITDEPPQLHQYNYIPNSPASKPEEYLNIKDKLEDDCQPGDLNINPALIFDKPETDTTISLNTHAAAKTYLMEEIGICKPSIKFSSFNFCIPNEIKTTESVAAAEKAEFEVFQNPVKPVENLDIYANTTNKVENDPLGSQEVTAKDCLLLKKDFSNDSPTHKSLILCENDQPPPALKPSENQPTMETVQDSAAPQKVQSITQDGKVHCDICFMCFRTVPGLKRHKAMKHFVRAKKYTDPQSTTISHQGRLPIHEALQIIEKNPEDDPQTCYSAKIHGLPDIGSALISKVASETESVLKEMEKEDAVATHVKDHQNLSQPVKTRKDNKARKNKNSVANIKPDPFSDEHLNVIKTDILQAISPDFKSSVVQEHDKSQKAETKISDSATETTNYGLDSSSQCSLKEKHVPGNAVELHPETNTEDITVKADTELSTDCDLKIAVSINKEMIRESDESGGRMCGVEKMCEQKESQEDSAQDGKAAADTKSVKCSDELATVPCLNPSPLSSPSISPDLNALLDDDTTFSQLFPRDEEAKRKKCSRVYSKRNKRQTLPAHGNGSPHYLPAQTFAQNKDSRKESEQAVIYNQAKHSAYETISIDDAMMLNMCHNSTIEADMKLQSHGNQSDEKEKCGKTKEDSNIVDKSLTEWRGTTDFFGFNDGSVVKSDPSNHKTETSTTTTCPPMPTVPHTTEPSPPESVQPFHSIDIQNINTTFQLPEIQFFDPNKDISVTPPIETVGPEQTSDDKSKKVTERRGRKRQDGVIKVKDKQYKCKVCFTWFLTLGELNFHKLSHNPSPPPTCYMCVQRKFSSREQLRDHLREKHAKNKTGIWTCGMCLKEISDVWMYNEHLREHATQFARRGQNQGAMLGIPGCFMQETAVKNFISSIMQQRPNKASKAAKTQEKTAGSINREENTTEGNQSKLHKTKSNGSSGKQSGLTPLEVLHKTGTPKSVEMHPNCKDPSRDCHHCGKQFPKPFKLQRHLVVHNLERIFLCHKCPVSYQEAQDLKDHLQRAHKEVEELDSKHTTLYTCELCADVMHVIKKSFICSTCNYTFSKKEQFDRHMEKHLSGGNKIFKFRGVLRPVKVSASKENECDSPASKKRRICSDSLQENSSDSGIASVSSVHLNQNSDTPSSRPLLSTVDDSTQTTANEYHRDTNNTNVKTEEMAEDYSELLVELDKCIHQNSSASKKEDLSPSLNLCREENGKLVSESYDVKTENDSVCIRAEPNSWSATKEKSNLGEHTCEAKIGPARDDASESETTTDSHSQRDNTPVSLGENQAGVETSQSEKQKLNIHAIDQLRDVEPIPSVFSTVNKQQLLSHGAEQESSSHNDIVSSAQTSDILKSSSAKASEPTAVFPPRGLPSAAASAEDRETVRPQKKRKDMKPPHNTQKVSSPVTQENFDIDARVSKKFRPNKYASSSLQRKSDGPNDYPVLSSVRDDVVSNKIVSKCKTINLDFQSKRSLLDNCTPKKTEVVTPQNGNYKTKKGALGRSLHSSLPKVPISHTFNKSRPKVGIRLMESHSYRTAESQNNLLSQLFGQKLTSFKIPLRKDTSESLN